MKFIFFRKKLNDEMRRVYDTKTGSIIYGLSHIKTRNIFLNVSVIGLFSRLIETISHESIHVIAKLNGSEANEKIIESMVEWCK